MAIVVSHIADDFDVLERRALERTALCDIVEIRLDRIGHPGKDRLARFFQAVKKPVIVSVNGSEAYGSFTGSADELFDLYHEAAEAGARFVDIDYRLSLDLGEVEAPCHRIVSRHEPDTPDDLDALLEEIREVLYEGDVTKLVTHAHSCEDGMRLLRWLRTTRGVVSFCAGEKGSFTRILAPIFGSPFTYCAPASVNADDASELTAPGQLRVNDLVGALPPGGISQETAIFGVVGNPVRHSWSPWVQGMALKAARLDAVYVAFEPESFPLFLELADDENYRGFSVTAPFKEQAFALVELRDEGSTRTGASNTLLRDEHGWRAANTDVSAVRETLEQAFLVHGQTAGRPVSTAMARTLILGAGGAARAAAWAVMSVGGRATVAARDPDKASCLAEAVGCEWVPWDSIPGMAYDVLIHATPVGSTADGSEDEVLLPLEWLRAGTLVVDAVYRPIRTRLLVAAHEQGCTPVPGGEWFVRQAIAQFKLFTRQDPDEGLMRKAFEHAHDAATRRE